MSIVSQLLLGLLCFSEYHGSTLTWAEAVTSFDTTDHGNHIATFTDTMTGDCVCGKTGTHHSTLTRTDTPREPHTPSSNTRSHTQACNSLFCRLCGSLPQSLYCGCQTRPCPQRPSGCHPVHPADWPPMEGSPEGGVPCAELHSGPPSSSAVPGQGGVEEHVSDRTRTNRRTNRTTTGELGSCISNCCNLK